MFNFASQVGRANTAWESPFCSAAMPETYGRSWSELDPDEYILLHASNAIDADGLARAMLDHIGAALMAAQTMALSAPRKGRRSGERRFAVRRDWYPDQRWNAFALDPRQVGNALESIAELEEAYRLLAARDDDEPLPLALTRIAFYAGFNPASVFPSAQTLHEFFCIAGWLGFLWRGRSVSLPPFVANYWLSLLDSTGAVTPEWAPDAFMIEKARGILDLKDLLCECARVGLSRNIVLHNRRSR